MHYNTAAIRELLKATFDDEGFTTFCFDYFRPVYEHFGFGMSRLWKIQLLIDHCEKQEQLDELLARLREIDPKQYDKFIPSIAKHPRVFEMVTTDYIRSEVEVTLRGDFPDLHPELITAAIGTLAGILNISRDHVHVLQVKAGSMVMRINLPAEAADRLVALAQANAPAIQDMGIEQVRVIRKQSTQTTATTRSDLRKEPQISDRTPDRRPAMESVKRFWSAFKDIAIVFSFVVNFVLILVVFVLMAQYTAIKDQVGGLVTGLDHSFASLGEATISTTIPINQQLPVKFDLPVKFVLPLSQDTTVTTVAPTPINTTVNLSLGQFGRINAPVTLSLPTGTQLRVRLNLNIPVSTTVGVNQSIPVKFDQSAQIKLGPSGLNPVVAELRGVVSPYVVLMQKLP